MKNLHDALIEQLKDLYSAETQLIDALPKMAKGSESPDLRRAFENHLTETQKQVKRLDEIAEELDDNFEGHTCQAMKGLIKEGSAILQEEYESGCLKDVMLVAAAQRVEHYEIAGYGNAIALADYLGLESVRDLLQETIEEEGEADNGLTLLCQEQLFEGCPSGDDDGDSNDDNGDDSHA